MVAQGHGTAELRWARRAGLGFVAAAAGCEEGAEGHGHLRRGSGDLGVRDWESRVGILGEDHGSRLRDGDEKGRRS